MVGAELLPVNDGNGRLMVATLGGANRGLAAKGELPSDKLLTHAQVGTQPPTETGVAGRALHPDFANPGTFGYGKLYSITPEGRGTT